MRSRTGQLAATAVALALTLAACGGEAGSSASSHDGREQVTVAALPLTDAAALYLARDRGLFAHRHEHRHHPEARARPAHRAARPGEPPPPRPAPAPVHPGAEITAELVFDHLRVRLPRDRVLVEEAPSHRDALHARVPVDRSGGFLTTGSGALCWGLPLAVGRALADRRRVVCVLGDGSALYSVQALWTAARHRAPVTFVVLDNGGYAAVRALGRRIGIAPVPGTDIGGIDFAALAESFGCPAAHADRPADLPAALERALAAGDEDGPRLLHLRVAAAGEALYTAPWAG
ncbi:thiamine pyrophosphate-dependent enzyme [Streptomyces sp. NPDC005202]|uniref:thiamine pyrophosphate-dependent enzyme n=1 Tax=Streptomyces sp. NPDC005202 TaxID=3157021 RepID=UPI0033AD92AE